MSDPSSRGPEKRSLKHHLLNRLLYAVIAAVIFGGLVFFIDGRFNPITILTFMAIFFVATVVADFLGKRL
ncbi:hypothetical protein [Maritalea myrionectae]|uniref:Uncharacterized protein n=1 Tax=Maritalea myrionectae TaxID=454601 RepID=A0A2R4MCY1_9HYPH|nr:hypothetical protein [Maritalea myrionectae]AVX03887.1 hypothetical protein MXMO3_01356 [Maritalea myrionectae]